MEPALQQALRDGEKLGLRYALQIPQVAASGIVGSRLGRRAGSSIDFQDYREYQPGDDLRFIDWGIYARTDRLSIKLFREEVTPHLDLVLDGSRSMNLEGKPRRLGQTRRAARHRRRQRPMLPRRLAFERGLQSRSERHPARVGVGKTRARQQTHARPGL